MRLRRSFRLGMESYRTGDKSIVIPAKAGTQDPRASTLAPSARPPGRAGLGQALDPCRGGDEKKSNRMNIRAGQAKVLTNPSRTSPRLFSTSGEISPVSRIALSSSGCVDLSSPSIEDSKRPTSETATVSR